MPELSILDARLAEIDRRLETIQSGLDPAAGEQEPDAGSNPAPSSQLAIATAAAQTAAPAPAPPEWDAIDDPVAAQLDELIDLQRRLVNLLASRPPSAPASGASEHSPVASVTAGPFATVDALRRFEATLAALPEVREVVLREYAGEDRAVLDVHLREPTA